MTSKTMGRMVSYNFLVVDGRAISPASSLDDINGVLEFEDVSPGHTPTAGPMVVIKVTDKESNGKRVLPVTIP
jgi:hypothetical protein